MERTIVTPRLSLTLVEKAERGSQELEWLHTIRSDEQTTWWSVGGGSKTLSDTEKYAKNVLPPTSTSPPAPGSKPIRILYAIHELLPSSNADPSNDAASTRLIGLLTLKSLLPTLLPEANHLFPPSTRSPSPTVLTIEIGYLFLPAAWGRGFATEAVNAVLGAAKQAPKESWGSWEKLYVQAVVDKGNKGSKRVMEKSEMEYLGEYKWVAEEGGEAWMGGGMRGWMELCFWGMWVVE